MIYTKVNPVGIDEKIQRIQVYIYNKLVSIYSGDVYSYGRIYKNESDSGIKPLFYLGNGEYKEINLDDRINGLHFFFVEKDEADISGSIHISSNDVDIIFIINDITKIRGDVLHYPDEEIKETIKSYLQGFNFIFKNSVKGKKALEGFDINSNFIFPYYVFKLTGTINNY